MTAPAPTIADSGRRAGTAPTSASSILLACAGSIWLAASLSKGAGAHLWLAGHLVIVGVGVVALLLQASATQEASRRDISSAAVILFATAVLGPVGTIVAILATALAQRNTHDPTMLDAWYQRISDAGDVDRVTRLATAVSVGRSILTQTALPSSFEGVIADGTTVERQNALGLIARRFAPDYAPALKAALVSSEPLVRVQAAAVAVKVKAELAAVLDALAAARVTGDPGRAAEAAAELEAIARTGLLDAADVARAAEAAARLIDVAASAVGVGPGACVADTGAIGPPSTAQPVWVLKLSPEARLVLESELLRQRRFADFRALRAQAIDRSA